MDRRAKKLEKKRKGREQLKKKASALASQRPSTLASLVRSAARAAFGPCFVSATWDEPEVPSLVSVVMTRMLPSGHLLAGSALVDRTCVGVKDAFIMQPMTARELTDLVDRMAMMHGGMLPCEPLVAQSVVFHAIDYARTLGFEPHRDFEAAFFGPRPEGLLDTPWSAPDRPFYVSGPRDNETVIIDRLTKAVGPSGFDCVGPFMLGDDDDDQGDGDLALESGDEEVVLVHSPLERTVSRDGMTLRICIYRGQTETVWCLEVEDQAGGSTTWDEPFATDREALEAALGAIEEDGIESFLVRSSAETSVGGSP